MERPATSRAPVGEPAVAVTVVGLVAVPTPEEVLDDVQPAKPWSREGFIQNRTRDLDLLECAGVLVCPPSPWSRRHAPRPFLERPPLRSAPHRDAAACAAEPPAPDAKRPPFGSGLPRSETKIFPPSTRAVRAC